jgi:hypothetical protein
MEAGSTFEGQERSVPHLFLREHGNETSFEPKHAGRCLRRMHPFWLHSLRTSNASDNIEGGLLNRNNIPPF